MNIKLNPLERAVDRLQKRLKAETIVYATLALTVTGMTLLAGQYISHLTSRDLSSVDVPIAKFTPMPTTMPTSVPALSEPTHSPQPSPTGTSQPTSVVVTVHSGDSWQRLVRRECYAIGIDLHPVDVAYLADVTESHNQCFFETEFAPCQFLPAGRSTLYAGDTVMILCEE
jgi:hypothetical protein